MTHTGVIPCPAGCGRQTPPGGLLCGACWEDVPQVDRDGLRRAWKTYTDDPTDARWFAYVEVRETLIDTARSLRC